MEGVLLLDRAIDAIGLAGQAFPLVLELVDVAEQLFLLGLLGLQLGLGGLQFLGERVEFRLGARDHVGQVGPSPRAPRSRSIMPS